MFGIFNFRAWKPAPRPLINGEWQCDHCKEIYTSLGVKFFTPDGVLCLSCNNSLKDVK